MSKATGFSLMDECNKYEVPTKEENVSLIRAAQQGDEDAKNAACLRNARLIHAVLRRYYPSRALDEDFFQQGVFGLITAIERFDCDAGFTFSTYAFNWIRQSITRYHMDTGRIVRIPVHMQEHIAQVRRKEMDYFEQYGELPSNECLAKILHLEADMVRDIRIWIEPMTSLDSLIGSEDGQDCTVGDFVHDNRISVESEAISSVFAEDLLSLISQKLTDRECEIIKRRFGFGYTPQTLEEIGVELGVSRERIRQLEERALGKLRRVRGLRQLIA